jgi:hypothetical protein
MGGVWGENQTSFKLLKGAYCPPQTQMMLLKTWQAEFVRPDEKAKLVELLQDDPSEEVQTSLS